MIVDRVQSVTKKKVHELEGVELDYWVGLALGGSVEEFYCGACSRFVPNRNFPGLAEYDLSFSRLNMDPKTMDGSDYSFHPTEIWDQGGPIIERERITVGRLNDTAWYANMWTANGDIVAEGPRPLVAVMRCFVASKFDEQVLTKREAYNGLRKIQSS